MYQTKFLERIFSFKGWNITADRFKKIQKKYYLTLDMDVQYDAQAIINTLSFSRRKDLFIQSMNSLQEEKLYASAVHGEDHILRVCILCFFLSEKLGISDKEFIDLLEIAKYHDIGRINDKADKGHGLRGAILIEQMNLPYGKEKLKKYQAVIASHSLRDEDFEEEWKRWGNKMKEINWGRNLLEILKDADALDRFRLRNQSLQLSFLHKDISLRAVQGAYEIYHLFPGNI